MIGFGCVPFGIFAGFILGFASLCPCLISMVAVEEGFYP